MEDFLCWSNLIKKCWQLYLLVNLKPSWNKAWAKYYCEVILIRCRSITEATGFTTGCPPYVLVPWLNFPLGSCSNVLLLHNTIPAFPLLFQACSARPILHIQTLVVPPAFLLEGCAMPQKGFFFPALAHDFAAPPHPPSSWQVTNKHSASSPAFSCPADEAWLTLLSLQLGLGLFGEQSCRFPTHSLPLHSPSPWICLIYRCHISPK